MPTAHLHRILIVDDAVEVALCFTRVLERYGFEVNYVTDGMEALALHRAARAEERPFTLLILDWAMPILSGLDLARAIRKSGDTVKIVETRPLSKLKRWRLVEVIGKAKATA